MAWKIWMCFKGNRDDKAVIHFVFCWLCYHNLERLTYRATSVFLSNQCCSPKRRKNCHKYFIEWCGQCSPLRANPNHGSDPNHLRHFTDVGLASEKLRQLSPFSTVVFPVVALMNFWFHVQKQHLNPMDGQAPASHRFQKVMKIYVCTTRTCGQ